MRSYVFPRVTSSAWSLYILFDPYGFVRCSLTFGEHASTHTLGLRTDRRICHQTRPQPTAAVCSSEVIVRVLVVKAVVLAKPRKSVVNCIYIFAPLRG